MVSPTTKPKPYTYSKAQIEKLLCEFEERPNTFNSLSWVVKALFMLHLELIEQRA